MSASPHFKFVTALANELSRGEVELPSFPGVVVRIRDLLKKDDVLIEQVSQAVNTDPMLVSRLLIFANSTHYNPAGVHIESLDIAISRLGFELVRNTAMSLAIKQIFLADQYREILPALRDIWQGSMRMAAMCSVVATDRAGLKHETAFLCGLLSGVGKLYIYARAREFHGILDDPDELEAILSGWHTQVAKGIIESWNFPAQVAESVDPDDHLSQFTHEPAALVDVVFIANELLERRDDIEKAVVDDSLQPIDFTGPAYQRLEIGADDVMALLAQYDEKVAVVREALAG